ncbi:alpha/beta hydrolase [Arthrobacter sp.]|uniref:alpha/beta hydrolase n=1 Tax=Arthrobacter sp. TaxID=1667 RepID=UPI0026DFA4EB|nr:alpha/beta hydrolase [Arthrobacter sp.]MDO5753724.1 alpha/beta hydrolase [Arthrobacter sp.]
MSDSTESPNHPVPVVFIHGLWLHSSSWDPWLEKFRSRGYSVTAPGWPGEGETVAATREEPDGMNDVGIDAICHHYADLIGAPEIKPIVIGHSFGGLIAQELLAHGYAAAAVAIDPAPIKGVKALPFSALKTAFPVLSNPANRKKTVSLNAKQFHYSFGNTLEDSESNELFEKWTIPGPGRPLFEDATANFAKNSPAAVDTHAAERGPLLLTAGTEDHTAPKIVVQQAFKLYADNAKSVTEYHEFEGRGHSLAIDKGWDDVANVTLEWLSGKGF